MSGRISNTSSGFSRHKIRGLVEADDCAVDGDGAVGFDFDIAFGFEGEISGRIERDRLSAIVHRDFVTAFSFDFDTGFAVVEVDFVSPLSF